MLVPPCGPNLPRMCRVFVPQALLNRVCLMHVSSAKVSNSVESFYRGTVAGVMQASKAHDKQPHIHARMGRHVTAGSEIPCAPSKSSSGRRHLRPGLRAGDGQGLRPGRVQASFPDPLGCSDPLGCCRASASWRISGAPFGLRRSLASGIWSALIAAVPFLLGRIVNSLVSLQERYADQRKGSTDRRRKTGGPDRIRLHDWPGSDARKIRIMSQRGAWIRRTRGLSSAGFWNVVRDMEQVGHWNCRATGPGRSWEVPGGFGKPCQVLGRPWETLGRSGSYDFDLMLLLPKRRFSGNLHVFEQVSGGEEGVRDFSSVGSE